MSTEANKLRALAKQLLSVADALDGGVSFGCAEPQEVTAPKLTAHQKDVLNVIKSEWPNGRPIGSRIGCWKIDVKETCDMRGVYTSVKTVERVMRSAGLNA